MVSHFFAYISKLRWIVRWGLKRNTIQENVMEHSWEVATLAHVLALIRNRYYRGAVDANAIAVAALYHDCSEVITGDLPSPVKYHSTAIQEAYHSIERSAERELVTLLPKALQDDFAALMVEEQLPLEHRQIIKAADTIAAYLKCQAEVKAGNREFEKAAEDIKQRLSAYQLPEVDFFLRTFAPSYQLTLDELLLRQGHNAELSEHERELLTHKPG
ncbi:MAG TPA: 5'-deoxynucleotidase [Spongiibacteraceae bacterium]|nr:5'-deoxynucleotidase [Spongiibacteraceae bacterium]